MITLKPVVATDAGIIFDAWGRYPENFARLTARVFADIRDAELYLLDVFSAPASTAFHILEPGGTVVGIVKAIVTQHPRAGRIRRARTVPRPWAGDARRQNLSRATRSDTWHFKDLGDLRLGQSRFHPRARKVRLRVRRDLKNWVIYPALGDRAVDNYSYVKVPLPHAP